MRNILQNFGLSKISGSGEKVPDYVGKSTGTMKWEDQIRELMRSRKRLRLTRFLEAVLKFKKSGIHPQMSGILSGSSLFHLRVSCSAAVETLFPFRWPDFSDRLWVRVPPHPLSGS